MIAQKDDRHIVKSFSEELQTLSKRIAIMGGVAEAQLASCIIAVESRDSELAAKVIDADKALDDMETDINAFTVRVLALRQPMASDLRHVVGALKISSNIERIGDYAANVAKRSQIVNQFPQVRPVAGVIEMGKLVRQNMQDVLDAYIEHNVEKAEAVANNDRAVDDLHTSVFQELLTLMLEDSETVPACTHLLFMIKNMERIGDHATSIAETIQFLVAGKSMQAARSKQDPILSSLTQQDPDFTAALEN